MRRVIAQVGPIPGLRLRVDNFFKCIVVQRDGKDVGAIPQRIIEEKHGDIRQLVVDKFLC